MLWSFYLFWNYVYVSFDKRSLLQSCRSEILSNFQYHQIFNLHDLVFCLPHWNSIWSAVDLFLLLHVHHFFPGEELVHDAFPLYNMYFDAVLHSNYASPAIAFESVWFIRQNIDSLCYKTPLLQKFFPNILKVIQLSTFRYCTGLRI